MVAPRPSPLSILATMHSRAKPTFDENLQDSIRESGSGDTDLVRPSSHNEKT